MKSLGLKIGVIVLFIVAILCLFRYIDGLKKEVNIAEQNRIAAVELYNDEKDRTFALNLKIEDLNRIKNAHAREMDSIRRELGVKDKQLKALYGSKTSADIRDTIVIPVHVIYGDTPHINNINDDCYVDTCVGDIKWYNICVDRIDSNLVVLSAHFESNLTLVAIEKKEPVNKPRKTWLGRLFQKKVKTMSITAVEQNPYVTNDSTLFIVPIK